MKRQTLTEQMDSMNWSDEAIDLFQTLQRFSGAEEGGAVVIVAAASLMARQFPAVGGDDVPGQLLRLGVEFGELMLALHKEMTAQAVRPVLRVVGGTDAR